MYSLWLDSVETKLFFNPNQSFPNSLKLEGCPLRFRAAAFCRKIDFCFNYKPKLSKNQNVMEKNAAYFEGHFKNEFL